MHRIMKLSKIQFFVLLLFLILIIFVGPFAYFIGQREASLSVTQASPMQLAQAMQSDNFYSKYSQTMLLVKGKIKTVTKQGKNTVVQFETTSSPNILGKVFCNVENNKTQIKVGNVIQFLTVAHDALRQNTADVSMSNCYFIKD